MPDLRQSEFELLKVSHNKTCPYHPKTVGLVEHSASFLLVSRHHKECIFARMLFEREFMCQSLSNSTLF